MIDKDGRVIIAIGVILIPFLVMALIDCYINYKVYKAEHNV